MAKINIQPKFFRIKYSPVKEYDDSLEIIVAQSIVDTVRQKDLESISAMREILTSKLDPECLSGLLDSDYYITDLYAFYVQNEPYMGKTLGTATRKIGMVASAIAGVLLSKKIHEGWQWLKHFYIEYFKDYGDGFSKAMKKVPGVGKFFADKYEDTKRSFDHTGTTLSDWFNILGHWKSAIFGVIIAIVLTYCAFKIRDIYTTNKFEHDLVHKSIELYRELNGTLPN